MGRKAVMYRDGNYGALAVLTEPSGNIRVYDHGFDESDLDTALSILERFGDYSRNDDGSSTWDLDQPAFAALSGLRQGLELRGYRVDDVFGEKTVQMVSEAEAKSPDLPADTHASVHESVERGVRGLLDDALAVLRARGDCRVMETRLFPRPNATDVLGRPLPFIRMRALLERPIEEAHKVEKAVRHAAMTKGLVRATVRDTQSKNRTVFVVEMALRPARELCESFIAEALPHFQRRPMGARPVKLYLDVSIDETDLVRLGGRMRSCGAVTAVSLPDPRTIVLRIPSSLVDESREDQTFQERFQWVFSQLAPWRPAPASIGSVEPTGAGRV